MGNGDFFLTKVNPDGGHDWSRLWGSSRIDGAYGLAIDAATNLYVAGYAREGFDGEKPVGLRDLCVSKLRSDGTRLWTRLWGSTADDYGQDVAVDAQGRRVRVRPRLRGLRRRNLSRRA